MRCYTVDGTGLDNLRLEERPDPGAPAAGEAVIKVRAVALNYRDLMVADGRYGGQLKTPMIACSDMAGTVAEVGPGVTEIQAGDTVINAPFRHWPAGQLRRDWARTFVGGQGLDGVLAERVRYPSDALVKAPANFEMAEAATLPVAGLTAWSAVVTHGRTRPGEWVLTHGTGGVSLFAAQLAHLLGARTILTTSRPDKAERLAEQLHLSAVLDYRDADWPRQAKDATGGEGVDVVVEVAGGANLAASISACNFGARIALIGVLAGNEAKLEVFRMISRQITIRGIYMESTEELRGLVQALASSSVRPLIDRRFPFEQSPAAFAHLAAQRHAGKVVIELA